MEEGLKLTLSADAGSLLTGLNDATKSVQGFGGLLEEARAQMAQFREALKLATDPKDVTTLTKGINALQSNIKQLERAGNPLKGVEVGGRQAEMSIARLDNVIRELPSGTLSIESSIESLMESFIRLRKETGSSSNAFKVISEELSGAGGVALGIGIALPLLVDLGDKLFSAGEKSKEAAEKAKKYKEAVDGIFDNAAKEATNVQSLIVVLESEVATRKKKLEALEELKKINPEIFGQLQLEGDKVAGLDKAYKAYIDNLKTVIAVKIKQQQLENITSEILKKEGATLTESEKKYANLGKAISDAQKKKEALTGNSVVTVYDTTQEKKTRDLNRLYEDQKGLLDDLDKLQAGIHPKPDHTETKPEKPQFNFFDRFFDVAPKTAQDKAKQVVEMYKTAMDFARKNQKVFVGLDEILAAPSEESAIAAGKKFWDLYQRGLIQTRPDVSPLAKIVVKTPTDFFKDATKDIDKSNPEFEKYLRNTFTDKEIKLPIRIVPDEQFQASSQKALKGAGLFLKDIESAKELTKVISGTLTPAFEGLFSNIFAGKDPMRAFFSSIEQSVEQLMAKLVAAAAEALILSFILPGGGGGFSKIFSGLSGIPKLAEGGIINKPTLALVGEGREAEAVLPLSRLQNIIDSKGGGGQVYISGNLAVSGDHLKLLMSRTDKRQGRIV